MLQSIFFPHANTQSPDIIAYSLMLSCYIWGSPCQTFPTWLVSKTLYLIQTLNINC